MDNSSIDHIGNFGSIYPEIPAALDSANEAQNLLFVPPQNLTNIRKAVIKAMDLSKIEAPTKEELDTILGIHEGSLEQKMQRLDQKNELFFVNLKFWSIGAEYIENADMVNDHVKQGYEFLEAILPSAIMADLHIFKNLESISSISSTASVFINALSCGSDGIALLSRSRLLKKSEKLFEDIEQELAKQPKDASNRVINERMAEWKLSLELQREALDTESIRYGIMIVSTAISMISTPLKYLPVRFHPRPEVINISRGLIGGFSILLSFLDKVILFIELGHRADTSITYHAWLRDYKQWKTEHQPTVDLKPSTDKKTLVVTKTYVPNLTDPKLTLDRLNDTENYKKELHELLQNASFDDVKNLVQKLGLTLPADISTKTNFDNFLYTEDGKAFTEKLENSYIAYNQLFETYDLHIQEASNLYEKRKLIIEKKAHQAKMKLGGKEDAIKHMHRDSFELSMKNLYGVEPITVDALEAERTKAIDAFKFDELDGLATKNTLTRKTIRKWVSHIPVITNEDANKALDKLVVGVNNKKLSREEKIKLKDALKEALIKNYDFQIGHQFYAKFPRDKEIIEKWFGLDETGMLKNDAFKAKWSQHLQNISDDVLVFPEKQVAHVELLLELKSYFEDVKNKDAVFESWYAAQNKEHLLRNYVDHQNTLEITTREASKQLVDIKHSFEKRFIDFKMAKTAISFFVGVTTLSIASTFIALGFFMPPLAAVGTILLLVTIGESIISTVLSGTGYYLAFKYKPRANLSTYLGEPVHMLYLNARTEIARYMKTIKEKKLVFTAEQLKKIYEQNEKKGAGDLKQDEAVKQFDQAKARLAEAQVNVEKWEKKLLDLQNKSETNRWLDFAKSNGLETDLTGIDDVRVRFQEALLQVDPELLDHETREFYSLQKGWNIEALQKESVKNPDAFKKALHKYFSFTDSELSLFIRRQQALANKGLLERPVKLNPVA